MATQVHIRQVEPRGPVISIPPGATWSEMLQATGCEARFEYVPDPPPAPGKLSDKAAAFIASYEYEEPGSVLAIYWRYGTLEAEEFDTAEEAKRFIEGGEEYDSLAGEAIVSGDEITVLD